MATGKVAMPAKGPPIVPNIPRYTKCSQRRAPSQPYGSRLLLLGHVCLQFSAIDSRNVTLRALEGARRFQFRDGPSGNCLRLSSDDRKLILRHALEWLTGGRKSDIR